MSHFLVTGGCGFIGSHLVEDLIASSHAVTVLDDLSSGQAENLPSGVRFIHGDVACPETTHSAMAGTDGCFHLASIASVAECSRRWEHAHRVNQGGSVAVLAAARRLGGTQPLPVVLASSAAVYGDNPALPLSEQALPTPLSPYGADKLGAEIHARVAASTFGARATALRIFNAFGPRQAPDSPYSGVISIFIRKALAGDDLIILGDGEQTRDFIFVEDVVRAFVLSMRALCQRDQPHMAVYNVCGGHAVSIQHVARLILQTCGSRSQIRHAPARTGDIRASLGDPTHCRAALGFSATTVMATGLDATIAWEIARRTARS